MRQIYDDLNQDRILGRYKLGFYTVDETAAIVRYTLQSHDIMAELS